MADSKISALTENTTPVGTELLVTSEGSTNKKVTAQNVADLAILTVATSATAFGKAMASGSLVLLTAGPDTLYRLTQTALDSESLDDVTKEAVSLDIAGSDTTAALLESSYPAASNSGRWGFVIGTTSANGMYLSNGSTWAKQLDNSGDRGSLWDIAGGLSYSGQNDLNLTPGTANWVESDGTTPAPTSGTNPPTNAFDGNTGTTAYTGIGTVTDGSFLYKEFTSGTKKIGKFTYTQGPKSKPTQVRFVGFTKSGPTFTPLAIENHSGDGSISGDTVVGLTTDCSFTVYVTPGALAEYEGYGIEIVTSGSQNAIAEIYGEVVTDLTDSIDCVNSINKLANGRVVRSSTAASVNSAGEALIGVTDTSAARTVTLDTDDVIDGKTIIIKDESGGAATNNITIATEASETIDGASTATISTDYGYIKVYSDGTNWFTIGDDVIPSGEQKSHTLTGADPSQALDMAKYSNFLVDINDSTSSVTLSFSNPVQGTIYNVFIKQGVNTLNVTWPTLLTAAGGGATAVTATNDALDLFQFFYDGTNIVLINEKQNLS